MPDLDPQRTYLIAQALPKAMDLAREVLFSQSDAQYAKRVAEIVCTVVDEVVAKEQQRHG